MQEEATRLLQARLDEATAAFEARPSRPDDLARISKLSDLVRLKDAEVARVKEEMQYFKLELVNRENNFNKVFARSPQVGLLDPRAAKAGAPPGMGSAMRVAAPPGGAAAASGRAPRGAAGSAMAYVRAPGRPGAAPAPPGSVGTPAPLRAVGRRR